MKDFITIKHLFFILIAFAGFTVTSCKKETADYGETYIYMPQATVSGGVNNRYPVPSGGGEMTYNFKANNGRIDIMLGVSRSATISGGDFTVDVVVDNEATNQLVSSGAVLNAAVLPAGSYTLPEKVTVSGSNEATFYLSVDSAMLINDLAYTGQKLVLAVGIANPTAYTLSENNNLTMVVIDVDGIRDHFFRYREGFLYRKADKLMLNGLAYSSVGINSFAIGGCGSANEVFSDADIDALFASLPDNILVRTWAFPGNKAKTDKIIKSAEKYNIKLILTLGDGRSSCGHIDGARDGEWSSKTEAWYTTGFRGEYLTHVKDMADTYKNSPAIGMWEMLNEPIDVSVQVIKSFYNEVGMELKKADPNHLVSTGTWAPWAYDGVEGFQNIHNSNYIDVGSLHEGDQDVVESWHFSTSMQAMKNLNKVLMVSDIGIESGSTGCFYDRAGRAEMMKKKFDNYFTKGAGAALASSLVKTAPDDCSGLFDINDPIMNIIKNYSVK